MILEVLSGGVLGYMSSLVTSVTQSQIWEGRTKCRREFMTVMYKSPSKVPLVVIGLLRRCSGPYPFKKDSLEKNHYEPFCFVLYCFWFVISKGKEIPKGQDKRN